MLITENQDLNRCDKVKLMGNSESLNHIQRRWYIVCMHARAQHYAISIAITFRHGQRFNALPIALSDSDRRGKKTLFLEQVNQPRSSHDRYFSIARNRSDGKNPLKLRIIFLLVLSTIEQHDISRLRAERDRIVRQTGCKRRT